MSDNTFTVTVWDEKVVSGEEGQPRFANAHTENRYNGLIQGTSACDYLLHYVGPGFASGTTTAHGLERIEGSVAGRSGTFMIKHELRYSAEGIEATFAVVDGSGTGELAGLRGQGSYSAKVAVHEVPYTFTYSL
ncbi:DUF3224 domain-containing protein [Nonomuraea sp. NPDC000554]|uniref:DUF3224 domain-containing protein n=1 Tax=Nonomuraea sp. NPDC000554 TaxID=3154259 RepID=UPI003328BE2F